MKKFKIYLKEAVGTVSRIVWYGTQDGKALLLVPKKEYDKDYYAASLTTLKFKVRAAKALTKVSLDSKPAGEHYSVTVEFTTRGLQREETKSGPPKSGPPTNSELTKKKQEREKEDLKKRQENEAEKAREQDFRKKEADRRKQIQQKDAQARAKKLGEVLEVGTDETTSTFKKSVPEQ